MEDSLFRSISSSSKNSTSTQLRKLIIFLLHCHILFRKLWLYLTKASINKITLYQLAKCLILNQILYLLSMISINKTRHCWTVTMNINVHKHSWICFLIKLCELTLFVTSILVILDQKLCCSNWRTGLGLLTSCLLMTDRNSDSNYEVSGQIWSFHVQLHQD